MDDSLQYIKEVFRRCNDNPVAKTVYVHETCATETNQIQMVLDSVVDTIISKNLKTSGVM